MNKPEFPQPERPETVAFPGKEIMLDMSMDQKLRASADETVPPTDLAHRADLIRLAFNVVPAMILDQVEPGSTFDENELRVLLGESDTSKEEESAQDTKARITDLDEHLPADPAEVHLTRVRIRETDIELARLAADACGMSIADFGYAATSHLIQEERAKPDFMVRRKAAEAQADWANRKIFEQTDIQPWGDEDNRDYSRPDEDD